MTEPSGRGSLVPCAGCRHPDSSVPRCCAGSVQGGEDCWGSLLILLDLGDLLKVMSKCQTSAVISCTTKSPVRRPQRHTLLHWGQDSTQATGGRTLVTRHRQPFSLPSQESPSTVMRRNRNLCRVCLQKSDNIAVLSIPGEMYPTFSTARGR